MADEVTTSGGSTPNTSGSSAGTSAGSSGSPANTSTTSGSANAGTSTSTSAGAAAGGSTAGSVPSVLSSPSTSSGGGEPGTAVMPSVLHSAAAARQQEEEQRRQQLAAEGVRDPNVNPHVKSTDADAERTPQQIEIQDGQAYRITKLDGQQTYNGHALEVGDIVSDDTARELLGQAYRSPMVGPKRYHEVEPAGSIAEFTGAGNGNGGNPNGNNPNGGGQQ